MNSQLSLGLGLITAGAAFQLISLIVTFVQVLRMQLHEVCRRRLEALPDLAPDEAAALAELEALGFVRLSQSNVEYRAGSYRVVLLRHTSGQAYAELSFTPGGNAGYPVSFYSFSAGGSLLATSNRASWMIFASPVGVERADPYAETLDAHWKAHQARTTKVELARIDDAKAERRILDLSEGYLPLLQALKLCVLDQGTWHPSVRAAAKAAWAWYRVKRRLVNRYVSAVTDGPHQSQFYARGYLATENVRANRASRQNVKASLLVVTVLASVLLWGLQFNWMMGLVLVAVLLVHESGHALAMRAFGYRDMSMFFVPLVGAIVTGTPKDLPAWKQAIILFAGPLPGLIAGTLLLVFGPRWLGGLSSDWRMAASIAIAINLFNLLPLTPLDGGRLVELSLFARWPRTRLVFSALSLLGLVAFALWHRTVFFWMVIAFLAMSLVNQARIAKLQRAWRPGLAQEDQARNLFEVARQAFRVQSFARQYALVRSVFFQKAIRPSRWWEAAITLTLLLTIWSASGYTAYLASSRSKAARREAAVDMVMPKRAMAFDPPLDSTLVRGDEATANKWNNSGQTPIFQADEQSLQESIQDQAKILMLKSDLPNLDRIATQYRETRETTPAGFSKLALLYNGLERVGTDSRDRAWGQALNDAEIWLKNHPNSPSAVIIDAKLLVKYAWARRGNDMGDQVTKWNARHFADLVQEARQVLDDNKAVGQLDPEWYALRISVANWQGANRNDILRFATVAAQREPYYDPIHYAAVYAMLPKWGGTTDLVKQYVSIATALTSSKLGRQMYGRIYLYVARRAGDYVADEFSAAGEDWSSLNASMTEIMAAHPDAWNANAYRVVACAVGTKDDYRKVMSDLGQRYGGELIEYLDIDTPEWQRSCSKWAGV